MWFRGGFGRVTIDPQVRRSGRLTMATDRAYRCGLREAITVSEEVALQSAISALDADAWRSINGAADQIG